MSSGDNVSFCFKVHGSFGFAAFVVARGTVIAFGVYDECAGFEHIDKH